MQRGTHQILIGDNRKTLATITPGSVQCCVTSPPYFALRSYLPKDHPDKALELGSERTIEEYIAAQLEVFRLVRTALHPTGTLWVNIGDGYSNEGGSGRQGSTSQRVGRSNVKAQERNGSQRLTGGLQSGDQMCVPFRFALAMQADGWTLRDTIIWSKPSPMPISVAGWRWMRCRVKVGNSQRAETTYAAVNGQSAPRGPKSDFSVPQSGIWQPCPGCPKCTPNGGYVLRRGKWRTTTSFEYVFMFAKGDRYFADGDAVQEEATCRPPGNVNRGKEHSIAGTIRNNASFCDSKKDAVETRNPRSVWTIPSESLREKHYAAYPSELVRRIILAATSAAGCCPKCRTPYAPVVESERVPTRPGENSKVNAFRNSARYLNHVAEESNSADIVGNRDPQRHVSRSSITGYRAACQCDAGEPVPCIVLDPYLGSGTTAQVATWYGRDAIGCELNEEYAAMAERRIRKAPRCLIRERAKEKKTVPDIEADEGLFANV